MKKNHYRIQNSFVKTEIKHFIRSFYSVLISLYLLKYLKKNICLNLGKKYLVMNILNFESKDCIINKLFSVKNDLVIWAKQAYSIILFSKIHYFLSYLKYVRQIKSIWRYAFIIHIVRYMHILNKR